MDKKKLIAIVALAGAVGVGLGARELFDAEAAAASRTVTIDDTSTFIAYGARVTLTPDGGCAIHPECGSLKPDVVCKTSPQPYNRGSSCTNFRTALERAITIDNGVSDGGAP